MQEVFTSVNNLKLRKKRSGQIFLLCDLLYSLSKKRKKKQPQNSIVSDPFADYRIRHVQYNEKCKKRSG